MQVKNVVIVNDFNYTQGGASKVAIDTARLLKENKYNVIFFSAVNNDDEKIDGVKYITTNQNEALKEKNKLKGIINGIYNFKAKKEFKKLLRTLDKDTTIIHVHGWTKALSSSVFDIAFKMKFKVVLTLHDYFTACPNGGYFNYKKNEICHLKPLSWKCIKCNCDSRNYMFKIYRIIRQFVQNKVVKLNNKLEYAIGISELSMKILKSNLNSRIKIAKIYNPVDFENNGTKIDYKENDYFLYVGRISKEKGVDVFCKAIKELNLKGVVMGDGDEKKMLEKEYSNIKFTGWRSKEEVKKYMMNAKALIFPSLWYETAGLTALEANKIGIPVIVNSNTATSEFINNGYNGFTYSSYSELIGNIKKINNGEIKDVNKFDLNNYEDDLLFYYNEM